jgi:hypothetical protein
MIRFACAHCGMKFSVKPEFAGRQTCCPTCKQPLSVPVPVATLVEVPSTIDGPLSSLRQLGYTGGVSLAEELTGGQANGIPPSVTHGPPPRRTVREVLERRAGGQRYLVEGEVGRGGMGVVLRAVDCDLRREVAVKYLLNPTDPARQARFIDEAQITGQLEHPNIAPVHELGVDAQKCLFFSMKMVRGRSLAQVVDGLRRNPSVAEREYPLSRLLLALVNVCHALAYAHSRGVVHRDLKPANVMLGDFGEVYVMDWGLAKVLAPSGSTLPDSMPRPAQPDQPRPAADRPQGIRPGPAGPGRIPEAAAGGCGGAKAGRIVPKSGSGRPGNPGSLLGYVRPAESISPGRDDAPPGRGTEGRPAAAPSDVPGEN